MVKEVDVPREAADLRPAHWQTAMWIHENRHELVIQDIWFHFCIALVVEHHLHPFVYSLWNSANDLVSVSSMTISLTYSRYFSLHNICSICSRCLYVAWSLLEQDFLKWLYARCFFLVIRLISWFILDWLCLWLE